RSEPRTVDGISIASNRRGMLIFGIPYVMNTLTKILAVSVFTLSALISASAQTPLPSLKGGTVDVQAQRGKVVIIAIGASWLPLSGKQAEFTNALAKKYAGKNVALYFIATDSTNPRSKNYATDDQLRQW